MIYVFADSVKNLIHENTEAQISSLAFGEIERARLLSIKNTDRRDESLGSLLCLERLLGYIGAGTGEIRREDGGKPYFAHSGALPFSLSHTHGICAAALSDTPNTCLGLDIEVYRQNMDTAALAKRFFSENEYLSFLQSGETQEFFLRLWTAKEAAAKLTGNGLTSILKKDIPMDIHIYTENIFCGDRQFTVSIAASRKTSIKILKEPI